MIAGFLRLAAVLALAVGAPAAHGQGEDGAGEPGLEAPDPVEAYLRSHDLDDLLSRYLLDELAAAPGGERASIAERLGKHYAQQLSGAGSADRQRQIEEQARQLLALVPDSDAFELRITLYNASFLLAEGVASRHAVQLTTVEEANEALETFRAVEPAFLDIGRRIHRRVESLEQMESRSTSGDLRVVRDQLADARRLRSLAMYYAGWSQYYAALMTEDPRKAKAARESFGWLLNASGGREPDLAMLPASLLRYEHVARAAMACALAHSVSGEDTLAVQWLDALDSAGETPPEVREELWARRIEVLARARRWADLQRLIERRRLSADPASATPLPVGEARLVAVLTLAAIEAGGGQPGVGADRARLLEALAQVAMGDLVAEGEIGHVLDLVNRFGTTPMGDTGFVVLYVRGLRAYERARESHEAAGGGDEPTTDTTVANRYMDAVRALDVAEAAPDAEHFPKEFTQARMMQGLALYYAGDLLAASELFESVFERAESSQLKEESLWYAIVSLDRAVEAGRRGMAEDRDRLATLYLQSFPATDRAAKLLLRRIDDGLLTDQQAIAVLLDVPGESPLYEAARRHASRLMYRQYRASRGPERDYAAARFVEVAEELIDIDVAKVRSGGREESEKAAEFVVLRVRQALDAALSITVPDVSRARRLLDLLDDVATFMGMDLGDVSGELAYRRLQIGIAQNDQTMIAQATGELRKAQGVHARSGERLLYQTAVDRWRARPGDAEAAAAVVGHGTRVLEQFEPLESRKDDRSVVGVVNTVAEAAAAAWRIGGDESMRDAAIAMDKRLVAMGQQSAASLQRLAVASEAAGDLPTALSAWNTLMSGLREGSDGWFEARVESIRVLAQTDSRRAKAVLEQHKVLYPTLGPAPWGDELREIEGLLAGVVPAEIPAPEDAGREGGG
jgi:hypothetical protein